MNKYYYVKDGKQKGPVSKDELIMNITRETLIWFEGIDDWKPALQVEEVKESLKKIPPPIPKKEEATPPPLPKEKLHFNSNKKDTSPKNIFINRDLYFALVLSFGLSGLILNNLTWYLFYSEVLSVLSLVFSITSCVFLLLFIYRKWKFIKDNSDISPGQAVGFLFIPVFNFYWIFIVFRKYAIIFNKVFYRNSITRNEISLGLATTIPILVVVSGALSIIIQFIDYNVFRVLVLELIFQNLLACSFFTLLAIYIYKISSKINLLYLQNKMQL